jgi:hypothetical protein
MPRARQGGGILGILRRRAAPVPAQGTEEDEDSEEGEFTAQLPPSLPYGRAQPAQIGVAQPDLQHLP